MPPDIVDETFKKIGFTGSSAKALQFIIGAILVAISLITYSNQNQILPILGILFGAFFILKAIQ